MRYLLPLLSPFLRPILPITTFPPTTLALLRSSETIRHVLELSRSEMDCILEPDLEWFASQKVADPSKGLFGAWSANNLDGWVGREGPMVRDCLGGEESHRVELLEGVPHAFCLSEQLCDSTKLRLTKQRMSIPASSRKLWLAGYRDISHSQRTTWSRTIKAAQYRPLFLCDAPSGILTREMSFLARPSRLTLDILCAITNSLDKHEALERRPHLIRIRRSLTYER